MSFLRSVLVLAACAVASVHAFATESIEGLWMETSNYPASSVLRFEREGSKWVGKYVQVSVLQQRWGYAKGESVVRGELTGDVFRGEVLLKVDPRLSDRCHETPAYWSPIQMRLKDGAKLDGAWLQTVADMRQNCKVVQQMWQPYALERVKGG